MLELVIELEKEFQEKEKKDRVAEADKNFFSSIAKKDVMKFLASSQNK
ncbi:hypothetical protein [Sulfurimonas sp.]|nr:hypothetical protein [Sulfurimonas sp.]MBW6487483.1 hypothetical protein [Sulfurimonas sp.]